LHYQIVDAVVVKRAKVVLGSAAVFTGNAASDDLIPDLDSFRYYPFLPEFIGHPFQRYSGIPILTRTPIDKNNIHGVLLARLTDIMTLHAPIQKKDV